MIKQKIAVALATVLIMTVFVSCESEQQRQEREVQEALVQLQNDLGELFTDFEIGISGDSEYDRVFEMRNQRTAERNELVREFNATARKIADGTHELVQDIEDPLEALEIYLEWEAEWEIKFEAFDAETEEIISMIEQKTREE